MTSAIDYSQINVEYPIAGQDNDTQGFRDNFNEIKQCLVSAKSEIEVLQNNTLSTLEINDLQGGSMINGTYSNMGGEVGPGTITDNEVTIELGDKPYIFINTSDALTLNINNITDDTNIYNKVRVHIISTTTEDLQLPVTGVTYESTFLATLTDYAMAMASGKEYIFDIWRYNNTKIYLTYIGMF